MLFEKDVYVLSYFFLDIYFFMNIDNINKISIFILKSSIIFEKIKRILNSYKYYSTNNKKKY